MKFVFLHGFLGSPIEWWLVTDRLKARRPEAQFFVPSLFSEGPLSPRHNLSVWTDHFVEACQQWQGDERPWLVGYSMGARLALNALFRAPDLWQGVLLLAGHPGIWDSAEIAERRKWEAIWGERFLNGDWAQVMAQWNDQAVFTQTKARITPAEDRVQRELLALAFSNWSSSRHTFTLQDLANVKLPLHWWFGALDSKFLGVKDWLQAHNIPGDFRVLPETGHRIPLDQPEQVAEFLASVAGELK